MEPDVTKATELKEQTEKALIMLDAHVHPDIPYDVYMFLRGIIETLDFEVDRLVVELLQAKSDATNRPLLRYEALALELGTEVWVEYNKKRTNKWTDEPMFRIEDHGRPGVTNKIGFWPLDGKSGPEFGSFFRLWRHRPTDQEKILASWS